MKLSALVMALALVGFVAHAQHEGAAPATPPPAEGGMNEGHGAADHGDTKEHKDMKEGKKDHKKKKKMKK